MTDKELRKLSKADLLSLMLAQSKEIDRLNEELTQTRKELEDKTILVERSGSLAEASLAIFHVLEDAQKAADLYLENVKSGNYQQDAKLQEKTEPYRESGMCSHFQSSRKSQKDERVQE